MFLTTDGCSLTTIPSQYSRIIGDKEYELKDHLGNIRVTLSDARENSTIAKVTSATSYYLYFDFKSLLVKLQNEI